MATDYLDLRNFEAAKGYESPTFDQLKPQWQQFVLAWLKTQDYEAAALAANYKPKFAFDRGFALSRRPDIVKAIEEIARRRLNAAEQSKSALVHRLTVESMVSKADLTELVEVDGQQVERIRPPERVETMFVPCLGFVEYTREGDIRFNTTAQNAVRKLLAQYMKWDREQIDTAPPMTFNFGALKPEVLDEEVPVPEDGFLHDEFKSRVKAKNGRRTKAESGPS